MLGLLVAHVGVPASLEPLELAEGRRTSGCARPAEIQCTGEQESMACTVDGRPLGPGTDLPTYYPYGNASLASVYDTHAFLRDQLVPLSSYKAKALMIGNTASN